MDVESPGDEASQVPAERRNVLRESAKWLWRLFGSVRLALILVLIIAGLSLLGAITPLNIFDSIFFAVPGTMLMINIFVCSLNRWNSIKLAIRGGEVTQPESFFKTGKELKGIHLKHTEAGGAAEEVLRSHGYRVRKSSAGDICIAADTNRYYRLGTYLSHLSLILFVLAFIFGSHFGFRDTNFRVTEGETKQVGHDTNLSMKLVSFVYELYDNGMPKDYRSQVVLYENGQQVQEALIRVNQPLYYKGTRFYQSFFGNAAKMQVRNDKGQIIFDDSVTMSTLPESPQYFQGYFNLPQEGVVIRLIASSDADDPMIPAGKLAVGIIKNNQQTDIKLVQQGVPVVVSGLEFNPGEILEYSGFQVSQDPTNALIWIASSMFILGICAVFYFPHRQLWALVQTEQGGSRILIRYLGRADSDGAAEVNKLMNEIKGKLPPDKK